ncbi:MAG: MgtC/SapB family protein [Vicinamibacterales bacterium]
MMDNLTDTAAHLLQLAVAFVLALPIAWDREKKERSAGLRTFTLVAISTCGFLIAARSSFGPSAEAESRVWQGLLTGIGFIGSGAILKTEGAVRGTATAASIWNTAAVGAAVAYGNYDIAVFLSVANFAVLRWLAPFKATEGDTPVESSRAGAA